MIVIKVSYAGGYAFSVISVMVARRPTRILSFAAAALLLLTIPNCVDGAKKEPEVLPSTDVAKAEAAAKEHAALLGKLFPFASQLFRR